MSLDAVRAADGDVLLGAVERAQGLGGLGLVADRPGGKGKVPEWLQGQLSSATMSYSPVLTKIWVDKQSFQEVGSEAHYDGAAGCVTIVEKWSDFRPVVEGYEIPCKVERTLDGQPPSVGVVDAIRVNVRLDDTLFDPAKVRYGEWPPSGQ
jgi:hypothetical protein